MAGVQFTAAGPADAAPPCYRFWNLHGGETMCPTYDVFRVVLGCVHDGATYTVEGPWVRRGEISSARCNSGDPLEKATNPPTVWWEEG
ncbi:hypothetical protein [Kitasatospora aureofaciens]|uniref:hypothetical protein n=1 Tax=Kitasatospora aureofaciens TaxID=1894 RepID=UPI001C48738F|nr:hypothetical protein [Kitasatospora aureofaciens]MBV6699376.1 hypothetical protein [Kitasatospora aureofaciens]